MAASGVHRYEEELASLPLVGDVNILKSYMKWMEAMAEHVEKAAYSKAPDASLESYIKLILADVKAGKYGGGDAGSNNAGDEEGEEDGVYWSVSVGYVAKIMNVAAMFAYVGDFEAALAQLKSLQGENLTARLDKMTGKRKEIIVLLYDSFTWAVSQLKALVGGGSDAQELFQEASLLAGSLNLKWEELVEGGAMKQLKAIMLFFRGCLGAAMKVKEVVTRVFWTEVTELDPQCYIWFHYAYRVLRRIRRYERKGDWLGSPCDEEERYAGTAYHLCPDDIVAATDYALLLKDKLWMESDSGWQKQEAGYLKCADIFRKALILAKETGQRRWTRKIKVYLAEFLTMGKGKELDQNAGKLMFDELAVEYPTSSFVLHKLAKLYNFGLYKPGRRNIENCVDHDRALMYYKQALEYGPGNYACLMDYIKLLQRRKEYGQMIEALENSIKHLNRDYQTAKLHVLKGYITWIWNPMKLPEPKTQAIDSWLYVVKNFPNCDKLVFLYKPIYFDQHFIYGVIKLEILEHLEALEKLSFQESGKRMETLKNTFSKLADRASKRLAPRWDNLRGTENLEGLPDSMKGLRISSSSRVNSQQPVQEGGWQTMRGSSVTDDYQENRANRDYRRQWRRSEADEDDDWRKKN